MSMLRTIKPKNARAKRALDAREPQIVENDKTAIFVRGERTSEKIRHAMGDLHALKQPHSILFSKKNPIHPFEDVASLEFFNSKNDASLFVVGSHNKKRPDNLCFARCFDGALMDMIEVGVDSLVPMANIKSPKSTPGHRFLMTFQSSLFATHPSYILLKSMLLDFYNGHEIDAIPLMGLETVMCVTAGPLDAEAQQQLDMTTATGELGDLTTGKTKLPAVHLRVYTMKLLSSGSRIPRVALTEMGPRMDLSIRRLRFAPDDMLKESLRRPKMEKKNVEAGQGKRKKNIETDDMGDMVGRIHVGKQDLTGMQSRKMKGLKEAHVPRSKRKAAEESVNGGGEGRGKDKRAKKAEARETADENME